jgi:pectate lyase
MKEKQTNVSRLDYYQSMSAISKVTLQDLDAMIEGEPTAAGEVLVISAEATATAITEELVKSFSGSVDGSLPIVAHWNTGYPEYTNGMDPDYMLSLIENGLHVLPSWHLDPYWNDSVPESYYKASILRAAELNLPLVFITKPFEEALLQDEHFSSKAVSKNPAVINLDGDIVNKLSPFALDRQWYYAGKRWARSNILKKIQEWYPNPPLVMFVADKRVSKLNWSNAEESKRYIAKYSNSKSEDFKRDVIGNAWKEKYTQLKKGFKRALKSVGWKKSIKFVSYNEIPVEMGEYDEWKERATYTSERLSIWTDTADATTNQFHINKQNDESATDVHGVQSRANNIPFFYNETKGVNPSFAWQLSLSDSRLMASPEAYRGFTQLALWLTRPSIIRESIDWSDDKSEIKPYFEQITDSVEMIYRNELLHKFWTKGKLVANPYYAGPNDDAIPEQYVNSKRWFVLDVDVNPSQPWNLGDYISVWAVALELGETPNREWLLYVQSPDGIQENITVEIPNYKSVIVDSNAEGSFYIVEESENQSAALARNIDTEGTSPDDGASSGESSSPASSPDESTPPDEILYTQTLLDNNLINKDIPAFAGAEGPGANAVGGRGGRVIEVTNLNNEGAGSLREACNAEGPRIVVFKVSGTINIGGESIEISNPYLTIAGQSAPEGGITIRGQSLEVQTHDVVIQYVKIRTGNRDNVYADSLSIVDGAYNVIIDHCSLGWSNDENAEIWSFENPAHDITWSWNLLHEGLTGVEDWSLGLVTGSDVNVEDMVNITVQHNAFINFSHRLPLIKVKSAKVINNLIYNWSEWGTGVSGGSTVDIIGNTYKAGPETGTNLTYLREIVVRTDQTIADEGWTGQADFGPAGKPSIYAVKNVSTRRNIGENSDTWPMISEWYWQREWPDLDESQYRRNTQMPPYKHPITQYSAAQAQELVLAHSGASQRIDENGDWVDNRDSIDIRLINEYKNGTGMIPENENDVGGYLTIAQLEGYQDRDHDGMSDTWEVQHDFNQYDASDAGLDRDGDGYTNIEEFLNGTAP